MLLAEKLNKPLPDWLSNQLIVALNLLNTPEAETEVDDFETQLFSACHKDLISGAYFYAFVQALNKQPPAFLALLTVENLKKRLLNRLSFDFKIPPETATTFITELLRHEDIPVFLTKLAFQQHLFQLRGVINLHALNIALPGQTLPTPLFALPLLPLPENEGHSLKEKFLLVLNSLSRKVLAGEIPPSALTELLFVDWDSVWTELEHLIELSPSLINETLAQKVAMFSSPAAIALAEKLTQNAYPLLEQSASVEDALAWSTGYFDYCRSAFLYKQPLDEAINRSFSDWLLNQTARIARSKTDWRHCAEQIQEFLQADYVVVVVMVDALSALNQEILLAELQSLTEYEHLLLRSELLFAPLPTLTAVGKMAVLTGKPTTQLPSDQETALREIYQRFLPEPQMLKVVRSWKESTEHLENQTNLLVYFENRLDERLHECASFEKHQADMGYGLLVKRYTNDVSKATPDMLDQAAHDTVPKVAPLFWSFRIMVGLGVAMLALFALAFWASLRGTFVNQPWLLKWALYFIPVPWIAAQAGWIVAEYGRQPWTVFGMLPTHLSVSSLSSASVLGSIAGFVGFYTLLLIAEMYLMFKYARLGPTVLQPASH